MHRFVGFSLLSAIFELLLFEISPQRSHFLFAGDGSVAAYRTKSLSPPFLHKLPWVTGAQDPHHDHFSEYSSESLLHLIQGYLEETISFVVKMLLSVHININDFVFETILWDGIRLRQTLQLPSCLSYPLRVSSSSSLLCVWLDLVLVRLLSNEDLLIESLV